MDPVIPVVDHHGAMDRLDGDEELWNEIRAIWVEDAPQMLESVRAASDAQDPERLRRAAHALKGASANVGAARVAESARQIELGSPASDWKWLREEVGRLGEEVARALQALASPEA